MEMSRSDYTRAIQTLDAGVEKYLSRQVLDRSTADDGGCVSSRWGIASPVSEDTCEMIRQFGLASLTPESAYHAEEELVERIERGVAFLRRCQRPSGCIDLPASNFDSAPDTAFGVSKLADLAWYVRNRRNTDEAERIETALEPFLRSAATGIADGGFHTPNHRWVIVGALAQVNELYPDDTYLNRVETYLTEGIDINDDGEYSEQSHAIYSTVVNKHLIDAARALERPPLLEPVSRNLHTLMDFMNHDWTVDSSASQRRDQGQQTVPVRGAPNFYYMARRENNGRLGTAADGLLRNGGWDDPAVAAQLVTHFGHNPSWRDTALPTEDRADSLSRKMESSGVWRFRDGKLSVTVATETSAVVSLSYGSAASLELRVISPYFGTGFFTGRELSFGQDSATVTLERIYEQSDRPCYWEPLHRSVSWGPLNYDDRAVQSLPTFTPELTVSRTTDGIDVELRTDSGLEQVPFTIEARFPAEGWLELEESTVPAAAQRPVFLGEEVVTYHRNGDGISLGPGWYAHRLSTPPDDPVDALRVLLTDWTPIDRAFAITADDWTGTDIVHRTGNGGPASVGGCQPSP